MPRLCILTQYFPPEMGAPQARLSELGERLIDRGWQVEALTALPNYPTGRVFPGYSPWSPVVEYVGRIKTIRVPLLTAKTGFAKRLASYFSFVASATALGPRLCERPDLIFVESPPLFIGYAARALSAIWRCPYVFNVSDLWPESAIRMGILDASSPATRAARRLELSLYKHAGAITGQSSEIIDAVVATGIQVPNTVITNGVDPARFGPQLVDDDALDLVGREPGLKFVFAGLLGYAQGLDQLLDIAKALPDTKQARLILIGEGPLREHLAKRIQTERITRVTLVPPQARSRIPSLLAACDAAVISLGMSLPGAVPSKIYEAMAASLPILLIADGEAAHRVNKAGCGITVKPGDIEGACAALLQLMRDPTLREKMGKAGRRAAETTYNRDRIALELDVFLRGLLK